MSMIPNCLASLKPADSCGSCIIHVRFKQSDLKSARNDRDHQESLIQVSTMMRSECIHLWVAAVSYLLPQVRFEQLLFRIFFHMYVSSDFCFTLLSLLITVESIHLICMTKSLMYSVCKFAYY
ncbi:hypothetical protein HanPI659440_Chr13g0507711 [Helianthus annuus]|nr:hypothetical protein HanPI659440_Chr13g0507711 [Helianthus annuus]